MLKRAVLVSLCAVSPIFVQAEELKLSAYTSRHDRSWDFSYPPGSGAVRSFGSNHSVDPVVGAIMDIGSHERGLILGAEFGKLKSSSHFLNTRKSGKTEITNSELTGLWSQLELGGRQRVGSIFIAGLGLRACQLDTQERLLINTASTPPVKINGKYSSFQAYPYMSLKAEVDLKLVAVYAQGQYYHIVYQRDTYTYGKAPESPTLKIEKPADGYNLRIGARVQLGPIGAFADVSKERYRSGEGGVVIDSDRWPTNTYYKSARLGVSLKF